MALEAYMSCVPDHIFVFSRAGSRVRNQPDFLLKFARSQCENLPIYIVSFSKRRISQTEIWENPSLRRILNLFPVSQNLLIYLLLMEEQAPPVTYGSL